MRTLAATLCMTFAPLLFLTGCEETYEEKVKELSSFVKDNELGGTDYFLEKRGEIFQSEWYPVSLMFGFSSDNEVCNDLKQYLENRYPGERYRCVAGN